MRGEIPARRTAVALSKLIFGRTQPGKPEREQPDRGQPREGTGQPAERRSRTTAEKKLPEKLAGWVDTGRAVLR